MKTLGLLLVIFGAVFLADQAIRYGNEVRLASPARLESKHLYREPLVGVGAMAVGLLLLRFGRKSKAAD